MRCARVLLLVFVPAMAAAQRATVVQPNVTVESHDAVAMGVDYRPGETVRYTFSLQANLTRRVNPGVASENVATFTPRQYEVSGDIVATFAPAQPAQRLHGTLQFKGLAVKNWVSSGNVADMEACLQQLAASPIAMNSGPDGALDLARPAAHLDNRYILDAEDLLSLAQALFTSRIANQPLAPGQQTESANFPLPGMANVGAKMMIRTEYLANIAIAQRPHAEVRLTMEVPSQTYSLPTRPGAAREVQRVHGTGVWTYLLNLDTHQISFLHKTIRTETSYSEESQDSNELVRIPRERFTVSRSYAAAARRATASPSPEHEADLTAFEKSLHAASGAAAEPAVAAAPPASLGDIARRLRAQQAAEASAAAGESVPPGFKVEAFPGVRATLLVPEEAAEVQRTGDVLRLLAEVGTPTVRVGISITEIPMDTAGTPEDQMDKVVQSIQSKEGIRVLSTEKKTIHGEPAVLSELQLDSPHPLFQDWQSIVLAQGKAYLVACGSLPKDFTNVEALCRTVAESINVQ